MHLAVCISGVAAKFRLGRIGDEKRIARKNNIGSRSLHVIQCMIIHLTREICSQMICVS